MSRPLAIDLFAGLGGWTSGLLAEGYDVIGFDIERHVYGEHRYPAQLVVQDVLTLHGSQFRGADLIVASPPCQEFSWMAMPWSRAKQVAAALRGQAEFPDGYRGSRTVEDLTRLFDACFRIQREASQAAGRRIPMVVENVKGAQPWVGRSAWNFGSFHLWGDVPALMPATARARKSAPCLDWLKHGEPNYRTSGAGGCFRDTAIKNAGGSWFAVSHNNVPHSRGDGAKVPGGGADGWFGGNRQHPLRQGHSGGAKRKFASAMIAKIPDELARWIARSWKPATGRAAA